MGRPAGLRLSSPVVAGFQVSTGGRIWVSTEVVFEQALHSTVRVGNSTWTALKKDIKGTPSEPLNSSFGSDAVARSGPAGFFNEDPFSLAAEIASLTHGHREAQCAAGAFAVVIFHRVRGASVEFSVRQAVLRLDAEHERELAVQVCDAFLLGRRLPNPQIVAERFANTKRAGDALCLAILAASAATDGRELAGMPWGDASSVSDYCFGSRSVGSMVGQILGIDELPSSPLNAELTRIVNRLASDVETEFRDDQEWWHSYPGW